MYQHGRYLLNFISHIFSNGHSRHTKMIFNQEFVTKMAVFLIDRFTTKMAVTMQNESFQMII